MSEGFAERVRLRLKAELDKKRPTKGKPGLSQNGVAELLQWDASRISRLLSGEQEMTVEDLGALCFALGLHPSEAVRDQGLEFLAEMTPTELRVLMAIREATPNMRDGILQVLGVRSTTARPERYAKKPKPLLGKPRRDASGT